MQVRVTGLVTTLVNVTGGASMGHGGGSHPGSTNGLAATGSSADVRRTPTGTPKVAVFLLSSTIARNNCCGY